MGVPAIAGFGAACLSAVFNGSFAALSKIPSVAVLQPDPVVFNTYVCGGVFLSSWAVIPFYPLADVSGLTVVWEGIAAGLLFVGAVLLSFAAIPFAGLSLAQTVWSGSAVLVSFLWGAVGPNQVSAPLRSTPLSVVAVALLLGGIWAVVAAERVALAAQAACCSRRNVAEDDTEYASLSAAGSPQSHGATAHSPQRASDADPVAELKELPAAQGERADMPRRLLGVVFAACVGLFGGSVLVPMKFSSIDGIGFVPSFGIGAGSGGIAVAAGWRVLAAVRGRQWSWYWATPVVPAGLCSGVLWNLGNLCQIWAQTYAGLSYGVAYPILQCALVVAGLLGIFVFNEITCRPTIAAFLSASAVIVAGAALLGVYGPQSDES